LLVEIRAVIKTIGPVAGGVWRVVVCTAVKCIRSLAGLSTPLFLDRTCVLRWIGLSP
jgi:hypothetical protein